MWCWYGTSVYFLHLENIIYGKMKFNIIVFILIDAVTLQLKIYKHYMYVIMLGGGGWLIGKFCHGYQIQIYFALSEKSLSIFVSLGYAPNNMSSVNMFVI